MSDVVRLLSPAFTDEEQLPAKQMQTGYKNVRARMQAHERLVVTFHGHPDSVLLSYRDIKQLWTLMNAMIYEIENRQLISLADRRLGPRQDEGLSLDEGIEAMRRAMLAPDAP